MSNIPIPPALPTTLYELSREQLIDMCHRLHATQMMLFQFVQTCEARIALLERLREGK
jgi:hypothetical protein